MAFPRLLQNAAQHAGNGSGRTIFQRKSGCPMCRHFRFRRFQGQPGGTVIAFPLHVTEEESDGIPVYVQCNWLGQAQRVPFSRSHRHGHRHARRRESAHPQHVEAMLGPEIASIAHFDGVCSGGSELMLESAVEIQARIVVMLGDDTASGIANGDERIDILAQPIAHRLKADALAGRDVDGKAIDSRLAESTPECRGKCRPGIGFGRPHGQIVD